MRRPIVRLTRLFLMCALVASCGGSARHVTVFAAPWSAGTFARTHRELASRARAIGWREPIVKRPSVRSPPDNNSITALVGVRVPMRAFALEAASQLGSSAVGAFFYNPELGSVVTHTVRASESYAVASIERRGVRVGAGPVLVSARFRGVEELIGRTLPDTMLPAFAERTWSARVVGALGQAAYTLRNRDETGMVVDLFVRYRVTPTVESGRITLFPGAAVSQNALTIGAAFGRAF